MRELLGIPRFAQMQRLPTLRQLRGRLDQLRAFKAAVENKISGNSILFPSVASELDDEKARRRAENRCLYYGVGDHGHHVRTCPRKPQSRLAAFKISPADSVSTVPESESKNG